jgi:serine/threonine protein phosphatase PrpC
LVMMSILPRLRRRDHAAAAAMSAIRSAARSHVGWVRALNEDRVFERPDRQLWAVADGMGGHSEGDLAAEAVVDALCTLTEQPVPIADEDVATALQAANRAISVRNAEARITSGTTVVAAHASGDLITIFWVGDSRAYLVRGGAIEQLTKDHSLVQNMVDAGLLSPAAAERHPQANIVTRALGIDAEAEIDTRRVKLLPHDRILLCSDGFSRSLRGDDFRHKDDLPEGAADRLLANALRRDGSDNATLILVEIGDPAARTETER